LDATTRQAQQARQLLRAALNQEHLMDLNDVYVLLWSQSECRLHREALSDNLKENWAAFQEGRPMDSVPLVVGTLAECEAAGDRIRPEAHRRDDAREDATA
jgi:hypothetical protein